jgi:putative glutamine amidotransferase
MRHGRNWRRIKTIVLILIHQVQCPWCLNKRLLGYVMRPLIGITTSQFRDPELKLEQTWNGTNNAFAQVIEHAGGLPLMIPVMRGFETMFAGQLDGVLFSNGADVDPSHYQLEPVHGLGELDPERDEFEIALYQALKALNKPRLGVCRGMQLINIAEGGTLHQHIPALEGVWADHHQRARKAILGHSVQVVPESHLGQAFGTEQIRVNSYHHQGVKTLAPSLTVAARASDGLVEAYEGEQIMGVQWHPEALAAQHHAQLAPFVWLVSQAIATSR